MANRKKKDNFLSRCSPSTTTATTPQGSMSTSPTNTTRFDFDTRIPPSKCKIQICVRRERGYCKIAWRQTGSPSTDSFKVFDHYHCCIKLHSRLCPSSMLVIFFNNHVQRCQLDCSTKKFIDKFFRIDITDIIVSKKVLPKGVP